MTKETAAQFLPMVQALAAEKTIQIKSLANGAWTDIPDPVFGGRPEQYRIKPEPREWWFNFYSGSVGGIHTSKQSADDQATSDRTECIHVREVI
jgi:hypothetical protein